MSVQTMAIVAGIILAVFAVVSFVVAVMPARQHDPQRGMAVGCLMMFSVAMLIPGGLLAWGYFGGHPGIVKTIFWVVAGVVGYVAAMGMAMAIVKHRKEHHWR